MQLQRTTHCWLLVSVAAFLCLILPSNGSSVPADDRYERQSDPRGQGQDQNRLFGDVLGNTFRAIRETTRSLTNMGSNAVNGFGVNTEQQGFGGTLAGTFNLLSVGSEILTGVASHLLGGGDLFSGLLPNIG